MGIMEYTPREAGMEQLLEGAPNFDGVAERALQEQAYGSESQPQVDPVLQSLVDRLNTVTDEISALRIKIWGPMGYTPGFKQPPYLERERLHAQEEKLEAEEWRLKAQIREMAEAAGLLAYQ